MNLKEKYLWVTQRQKAYVFWTKWGNGETIEYFTYYDAPHQYPNYSAEDVFIYKDKIYIADYYNGIYVYNSDLIYERTWQVPTIRTVFVYKDEVFTGSDASTTIGAIKVYSLTGTLKRAWAFYSPAPNFYNCYGIYILDDNNLFASMDERVADGANSALYIYDINGNKKTSLDFPNGTGRPLAWGLYVYEKELYVTDYNQILVKVFDLNLNFKRQFGPGYTDGAFSPTGIVASGNRVVAEIAYQEDKLKKFTTLGVPDPTFTSNVPNPGGVFLPTGGIQYLPIIGMG